MDADCYQLMIVECYSADVYCDCASHPYGTPGNMNCPAVFIGRGKRDTDRDRRKAGWIKVNGRDVCPQCKSRKPIKFRDG